MALNNPREEDQLTANRNAGIIIIWVSSEIRHREVAVTSHWILVDIRHSVDIYVIKNDIPTSFDLEFTI